MANINETQRKYLMKRVEDIKQSKFSQMNIEASRAHTALSSEERVAYMKKELARVGLGDWVVNKYGNIELPLDRELRERNKEVTDSLQIRKQEFNKQAGAVLDKIILGDDAESLSAMLESLNNFN